MTPEQQIRQAHRLGLTPQQMLENCDKRAGQLGAQLAERIKSPTAAHLPSLEEIASEAARLQKCRAEVLALVMDTAE